MQLGRSRQATEVWPCAARNNDHKGVLTIMVMVHRRVLFPSMHTVDVLLPADVACVPGAAKVGP